MRRAADYLASLRDGRAVFLDGERVDDVTRHPAFAESTQRIAERYEAAAGIGRRHHLRRSGHRQADRRHVADPADRGRSRAPAGRPPVLGRGLVRPHGAHARPRGLGPHRLRGLAPALRSRGPAVRRQRGPVLREGAGRGPVPGLCDRPAPDRPHHAGPPASGALPAPGGPEGDGRRHRDPRRALDRHVGDHGRLALRELHHAARPRRRGLRDLAGGAGERGGPPAPAAPALRDARDERLRLPALRALRRGGHHRRLRRRVRALGAGLRLPERGAGDRPVPRIPRARDRELPVAGALRGQARAARRPRPEAGRGRARGGGRQHPGHARRRHRHVLRRLRRAGAGGRAPPARERGLRAAASRSTSTRG